MTTAVGPNKFKSDFEGQAKKLLKQITEHAQQTSKSAFSMDLDVPIEVQHLLSKMVLQAGFSKIDFHSNQRDGSFAAVQSNPFAQANVEKESSAIIAEINKLLNSAHASGTGVSVKITVPDALRNFVRNAYMESKWSDVTFGSSQREGDWITFSF